MYIVLVPEVHAVRIEERDSIAYLDLWPDVETQSEGFCTLTIDIRNTSLPFFVSRRKMVLVLRFRSQSSSLHSSEERKQP